MASEEGAKVGAQEGRTEARVKEEEGEAATEEEKAAMTSRKGRQRTEMRQMMKGHGFKGEETSTKKMVVCNVHPFIAYLFRVSHLIKSLETLHRLMHQHQSP